MFNLAVRFIALSRSLSLFGLPRGQIWGISKLDKNVDETALYGCAITIVRFVIFLFCLDAPRFWDDVLIDKR